MQIILSESARKNTSILFFFFQFFRQFVAIVIISIVTTIIITVLFIVVFSVVVNIFYNLFITIKPMLKKGQYMKKKFIGTACTYIRLFT